MMSNKSISEILGEIAELLDAGNYVRHARDIRNLSILAGSESKLDHAEFKRKIVEDKWYWLGMGTIADIVMPDEKLNRKFIRAYYQLAIACQENGCDSIYSRDVKFVFGTWIKKRLF